MTAIVAEHGVGASGGGPTSLVRRRSPVIASLDRPLLVERPDKLRDFIIALAGRLAAAARGESFDSDAPHSDS
jgi:hypothetical protein